MTGVRILTYISDIFDSICLRCNNVKTEIYIKSGYVLILRITFLWFSWISKVVKWNFLVNNKPMVIKWSLNKSTPATFARFTKNFTFSVLESDQRIAWLLRVNSVLQYLLKFFSYYVLKVLTIPYFGLALN